MNIQKFKEFVKINENIHETPEEYVKIALTKIKSKIEKMFNGQTNSDDVENFTDKKDKSEGQDFSDLNLELQSCELSRYSKTLDNVKVKYSDEQFLYDMTISIDLKDAVPQDETKDFSDTDIKQCSIKFKKYKTDDFELVGEITKTVDIKDINQDLLIKLKIQIDDEFGGEEEEFKIEEE